MITIVIVPSITGMPIVNIVGIRITSSDTTALYPIASISIIRTAIRVIVRHGVEVIVMVMVVVSVTVEAAHLIPFNFDSRPTRLLLDVSIKVAYRTVEMVSFGKPFL